MKKMMLMLMLALTLIMTGALARADAFTLDRDWAIAGMNDRSWSQGYQPAVSGDTMTLCLPIRSEYTDERIRATLVMADESVTPLRTQDASASFQASKGVYPVKLAIKLHSERVNGDYAAVVRIEGAAKANEGLRAEIPLVIRIRDGRDSGEALRPELTDVNCELRVGERATLTATLTNPSRYAQMTGIQLVVSDESGEILPSGTDKLSLPDLMPGESCRIEYPLTVLPLAKVSLHLLKHSLSYSLLGQNCAWEETFSLPVTQEIRLELGGVQLASSVIQGESAGLTLPLMNMGRGKLRNVLVKLSMEGIAGEQSVLVGDIEPGGTQTAKLTFAVSKELLGEQAGQLTVQCEDEWGNGASRQLPVSLTVEAAAPVSMIAPDSGEAKAALPGWVLPALGGACALLALMLVIQGLLLRGKIRRLEEARL